MRKPASAVKPRSLLTLLPALCALMFAVSAPAQSTAIKLDVDASDAPRCLLHAREHIPAKPGPLTVFYPKWIPGEHAPDGPINNLVDLKMSAAGKPLQWRRDAENMYAFHLDVPADADAVDVSLDFLLPTGSGSFSAGPSSSAKLLDLSWNEVLLYPREAKPLDLEYVATLQLPGGWQFGTALPVQESTGARIQFSPARLETLVDSPVIAGRYFRTIDLTPGETPSHVIHIVADSAAALEMKPEDVRHLTHLVREANALFGAHHYRSYHFLLTLSDHVSHFGLEHHESSDNRVGEDFLTDADQRNQSASLLPHEMVHSWNGKYRRPAGLATPDYEQPMKGDLLWVYEGLTTYLGDLLATRSGLMTNSDFREAIAASAAALGRQEGRSWRPLSDTTAAAQLLYGAPAEGAARRRRTDFYPEGELIWMAADTIIRQQSHGGRSLDDFCRQFYGGESGPPKVVPYDFEDVVAAMNQVVHYDWRDFFEKRIYEINPHAPLGGIENSGWRLAYTNQVPPRFKARETARKYIDLGFSLGFTLKEDGYVTDVLPGSPAERAGMGPSMKLVAVNGRRWTPEILRTAVVSAATNTAPIELLVENDDYFRTCRLDYHGGEKYPCLEREPSKPDLLEEMLKPLTPEPVAGSEQK